MIKNEHKIKGGVWEVYQKLDFPSQMNFLKRAMTSIMRRPGKSVILLLLVFILGTVISGAIAVDGAVSNTDANLRRGMRPIVTFQNDWSAREAYMNEQGIAWDSPDAPRVEALTPEMVRAISELPYVDYYEYSIPTHVDVLGFRNFQVWSTEEDTSPVREDEMAWLTLRGTSEAELLQVRENVVEIVDGQTFTESQLTIVSDVNQALVSAGFARVNGLTVGDIIELPIRVVFPQPDGAWDQRWELNPENVFAEETFQFEIIGLLDSTVELDPNDMSQENQQVLNRLSSVLSTVHVSNSVAEIMQSYRTEQSLLMFAYMIENDMELSDWMRADAERVLNDADTAAEEIQVSSVMVLNDPSEMDAFTAAAEEILPDFWVVESLAGGFDAISSSMETLQRIAFWILVGSVVTTLLILSLLITLFLRDRRYEMGVYLALGEKKGKIVTQILLEVVGTAVIGITLAVFTGNLISGMMSNNMLRNELTAEENNVSEGTMVMSWNEFDQLGMSTEMSPEDMLDAFDVSLNLETVGLFYAVGLGAVIFSTVVPVLYVVTLNPKKVLM